MRHDHLKRELELLLLLVQNNQYTTDDLCEKLEISRRSLYYYLEFFRSSGFIVEKNKQYHYISRESPFFKNLTQLVEFTEDEAQLIRQLIANSGQKTLRMKSLENKLNRYYDFSILENEKTHHRYGKNLTALYEAVKERRLVRLVNYASNNSETISDRIVEPFLFLNNNADIRAFEISTKTNKTFRLSRIESVEVLDINWFNEDKHKQLYTDIFLFSGEQHYTIDLVMGQKAHTLMIEEYPRSAASFVQRSDGKWIFHTDVCSYIGIGRFVIGLLDDIEVIGDEGFIAYLNEKLSSYKDSLNVQNTDESAHF